MFGRRTFKSVMGSITLILYVLTLFTGFSPRIYAVASEVTEPDFQKGICYATWTTDRFESKYSEHALEMLRDMGVEFLQINVTQFQDKFNSTEIYATECTPSDKSVKYVIKKAHKLGLKVMLKPHLDLINTEEGHWRADIGFHDQASWEKWFEEYTKFICHYAKMAEKNKVEIFCVGTELSFTTQQTQLWRNVIRNIKDKYDGELIYAANWDNYANIEFWDELDYTGIDAYFPLTYKSDPSLDDIKEGWIKWIYEIEKWYAKVRKPIIFTEIGYPSSVNAPSEPWKNGYGCPDVNIQAKCYTAFFDVVWRQPWLGGVYWWRWAPTIFGGGTNNRQFTPLKKPAAQLIERNYKASRSESVLKKGSFEDVRFSVIEEKLKVRNENGMDVMPGSEQGITSGAGIKLDTVNISTLQPILKTQENPRFQQEWREKHMMECVN